jgi:hypothetical protein
MRAVPQLPQMSLDHFPRIPLVVGHNVFHILENKTKRAMVPQKA